MPNGILLLKDMNCRLCPEGNKKGIVTSIKKQLNKDEVGMTGLKKYTNKICGDNHIHYTSLRLLFE